MTKSTKWTLAFYIKQKYSDYPGGIFIFEEMERNATDFFVFRQLDIKNNAFIVCICIYTK